MNNVIKRVWNQNRMVAIEDLKGMTFQAESGGHTFQISGIDDSGNTVALTGSVAGVFLRPDNTDVAISGSVSGGVAYVTLPANCYDVPGRFGLTVFVTANGQKTAVYAAMGTVSRTSSGTVSPGTTADVVDLINRINAAVATIPASYTDLMAASAPTYSASALYPVGSYAWYNGKLYRSISPIATAESWTAAHWTLANLGNDVRDLNQALGERITANADRSNWIEKNGNFVFIPQFVQGRYNSEAVTRNDNTTKFVRTDWIAVDSNTDLIIYISGIPSGVAVWLTEADKDGNYVAETGRRDTGTIYQMTGVRYIGINAAYNGVTTDISPSDVYGKIYISQKVIDDDILSDISINEKLIVANNIRDNLVFTNSKYEYYPTFIQGRYKSNSADINPNVTNWIRTNPIAVDQTTPLLVNVSDTGFIYAVLMLDKDGKFLGEKSARNASIIYQPSDLNANTKYIALNVRKNDSTDLIPSDYNGKLYIYQATIEEQIPKNVAQIKDRLTTDILKENHGGSFFKTLEFESGRFQSGTGLPLDNPSWVRTKEPILVNPKVPYIVSRTHSTNVNVYQYDADYKYIREDTIYPTSKGYGTFRTLDSRCYYVNIGIPSTSGDTTIFEQRYPIDGVLNIPDYFMTQLESKLPAIVQNMNDAGPNGTTFVFITDPHWDSNYKGSPSLIQYVLHHANIHNVFCGGDVINEGEKATMYAYFLDCVKHLQFPLANMFLPIARGNHDDNSNWSTAEEVAAHEFTYNALYNMLMNHVTEKVTRYGSEDYFDFYFDEPKIKTRYIFIDTKRDGRYIQNDAIINLLKETPENWHVIFVMHIVFYNSTALAQGADVLSHIVGAYNAREAGSYLGVEYNFTTGAVGRVDLIIGGHSHSDWSMDASSGSNPAGIPIIVTDTDSWRDHLYTGATIDSQCFDVVTVDYANETVKCVRIGRGSDRSFSY
jgi:hypothetical protein